MLRFSTYHLIQPIHADSGMSTKATNAIALIQGHHLSFIAAPLLLGRLLEIVLKASRFHSLLLREQRHLFANYALDLIQLQAARARVCARHVYRIPEIGNDAKRSHSLASCVLSAIDRSRVAGRHKPDDLVHRRVRHQIGDMREANVRVVVVANGSAVRFYRLAQLIVRQVGAVDLAAS
jgi:hypothetical protein